MQNPLTSSVPPSRSAPDRVFRLTHHALLLAGVTALLLPGRLVSQPQAPSSAANAQLASGIQLLQSGQFAAAKAHFTAAVKADPTSAAAFTWRGICENRLKQYREATTDFAAALRIDPADQPSHFNLALSLIRLNQPDAAIHQLEIVVAAAPDAVDAQYNLAILLEDKRSFTQAAEHLDVAYRTQPNELGVAQHLLLDDLAINKTTDADEILKHLQLASTPPEAQARIGAELVENGYFAQAASLIETARPRLPSSSELDLLLARAYIGSREDFKAIDLLKGSQQNDRSGQRAYLEGLAYMAVGASQEAIDAFRVAAEANPRDASTHFELGMLQMHAGEPERALGLQELREAVRLDPQNAAYSIAVGRGLLEADHAGEALPYLEQAHAQGREEAVRNLLLGIAQAASSGVTAAEPALQRAIELDPSIALSHNLLGFCYFQVGDYAQAAKSYKSASDLSPQTSRFAYDTALALERQNQVPEAIPYAERAVKLDPSSAMDHYLLGKLYGDTERKQEAIRELQTAIQLNPALDYPYYVLARIYLRMGDTPKAQELNAKFQQLKKDQFKLHGVASMSSAPSDKVSPAALLAGDQMDPETSGPKTEH
jgi:tetratricopeptide (TPR) repeat protein